jgi:hypothetical protein
MPISKNPMAERCRRPPLSVSSNTLEMSSWRTMQISSAKFSIIPLPTAHYSAQTLLHLTHLQMLNISNELDYVAEVAFYKTYS